MHIDASTWTKFRALTAAEWRVLLAASMLLPMIWAAIHAGALNGCLRRIARPRAEPDAQGSLRLGARSPPLEVARIAGLVGLAARYSPAPVTCLSRSIVLAWILRRHGVDSDLRIGVRMTNGALDAHAWLEREGIPIGDAPRTGPHFLPFDDPIAGSRER